MHFTKSIKVLLTAAMAAMAMSALIASSASASIVPAKFSSSGFKLTTSGITVKRNGLEPKTCTPSPSVIEGYAESSNFMANNAYPYAETKFTCGGTSSFTMVFVGTALYDTVAKSYSLHVDDFTSWSLWSPWGSYSQQSGSVGSNATWVNGSGATASTVTFKNQTVGWAGGKNITVEGTFKATTLAGGLVTLSQ